MSSRSVTINKLSYSLPACLAIFAAWALIFLPPRFEMFASCEQRRWTDNDEFFHNAWVKARVGLHGNHECALNGTTLKQVELVKFVVILIAPKLSSPMCFLKAATFS